MTFLMGMVPLLAFLLLLLASLLLEEAAAWLGGHAAARLEDDEAEVEARELAAGAREARILSLLFAGSGFVILALGAGLSVVPWARWGVILAALVWAFLAAGLYPVHWRSPLSLAGRAAFRGLRPVGMALRIAVDALRRIDAFADPLESDERMGEIDREMRWLDARRQEDETEKVLATLHEFGESLVEDVTVPRQDVIGLSVDTTIAEAVLVVGEEGFSRYPVYRESLDHVVGVLHVFDLLDAASDARVETLARPPLLTPATRPAGALLRELQASYNQLAVVLDEYGGTAGIVTVEDLLEELVGDIRDEHDEEELQVRVLEPGVYWVEGDTEVDELNEALELDLEEGDDYDTVAGLVLERLERIPRKGEKLQIGEVSIEVALADPHRIRAVKITVNGNGGRGTDRPSRRDR